ncbi:unnamed protein product [Chrysoparadoxa australica]
MRHLAVYMMLVLGGNTSPSKADVTKALGEVGVEVDEARLDQLLGELNGKDLDEIIKEGTEKLAKFGGGGGGGGGGAAAGGDAPAAEEKKEEEEEEEIDMGGGME